MKTASLLGHLRKKFPQRLSNFHGDRLGLHVGPLPQEIAGVAIGLDVSNELIDQAIASKCRLIITHHPFLYPSKKQALKDPQIAALYERVISNQLAVYCFHSNFDAAPGGMNDYLAHQAKLTDSHQASPALTSYIGNLPQPLSVKEASEWLRTNWKVPFLQLFESPQSSPLISKIAVCAGSGVVEWPMMKAMGVDLFVSGDSRYYNRVAMQRGGMHFLELHHEIEFIFMDIMKDIIIQFAPHLTVVTTRGTPFPTIII